MLQLSNSQPELVKLVQFMEEEKTYLYYDGPLLAMMRSVNGTPYMFSVADNTANWDHSRVFFYEFDEALVVEFEASTTKWYDIIRKAKRMIVFDIICTCDKTSKQAERRYEAFEFTIEDAIEKFHDCMPQNPDHIFNWLEIK